MSLRKINLTKNVVQQMIDEALLEEGKKNLDKLKPIDHATVAYPHTPIYKMHRYYARRPYSVFNELIKHYSNPGSIILDPFCGGGVTVVESLRSRRKVIGVDLISMATFITKMEIMNVDIENLDKTFKEIEKNVKNELEKLYKTLCFKCKKEVPAEWFEWSYVCQCPKCKNTVQLNKAKKHKKGSYLCYHCKKTFRVNEVEKFGEQIIRIKLNCIFCGKNSEKEPTAYDFGKIKKINNDFNDLIKDGRLWYPKDSIYKGQETNRLFGRNFKYFYELFTKRNLLSLSILFKKIKEIKERKIKEFFEIVFTSRLFECSRLSHIKDKTVVKPGHHYWTADIPAEANVWKQFVNAYEVLKRAKIESNTEINNFYKEAKTFDEIKKDKTCLLLTQSSTSMNQIPDNTIDAVITDPPYGGNVQYSELCDFWAIWIKKTLGIENANLINRKEEAVVNKYQNKSINEYRNLLYNIFKECHRVLKPERWLVFTFHNRDFMVWNAAHAAAHDAGFILDEEEGMIYQPPIQAYVTTLHLKEKGAMLGDFVLSFKKVEKIPEKKMIEEIEIGHRVRKIAAETIQYHGGAKLSTIYNRLVPFLVNNGLLQEVGQKDITKYLKDDFEEKNGKWYFKENVAEVEGIKPLDYVPVEDRIGYLITSTLRSKGTATIDDILNAVFSNLIDANAPDYEEITRVLKRIAEPSKGRKWQLKEALSAQKKVVGWVGKRREKIPEEILPSERSIHDLIIEQLVNLGSDLRYDSHIGEQEQRTYVHFRKLSTPMGKNIYGIPSSTFEKIKQIDILWLQDTNIISAFEVENSTTIDSGINRFRELFAATPALRIPTYIVVPDKREKEAIEKIGSLANRKEGLHRRIKIIKYSDVDKKKKVYLEKIAIEVI